MKSIRNFINIPTNQQPANYQIKINFSMATIRYDTLKTLNWNFGTKTYYREGLSDIDKCFNILGLDHIKHSSQLTKKCVCSAFQKKQAKLSTRMMHLQNVFKYNGRHHNPTFKRSIDNLTQQHMQCVTARETLLTHLEN